MAVQVFYKAVFGIIEGDDILPLRQSFVDKQTT